MYNEEEYFKYTNKQRLKIKQMETIKSTLDGTPAIDNDAVYLVDWSKLQSIEELILLLASIGFSFSPHHPQFNTIKHLLALNQPIKIGQPQQQEAKELKLPKLKVIKDGQ